MEVPYLTKIDSEPAAMKLGSHCQDRRVLLQVIIVAKLANEASRRITKITGGP